MVRRLRILLLFAVWQAGVMSACAQMGHVLDAVGPVNQSMGGAGVALPLDAIGALQWNPASITGLKRSEIGFSAMAFAPRMKLGSSVNADSFGPGFPAQDLQGATTSDNGISPIPSMAMVHRDPESPWTYGVGGFAIGGFGVDYPSNTTNPILTAQPPNGGLGFGNIYSQFQLMQFCPTAAYKVSPAWSVGVAPTFNWGTLAIDPFGATTPNPDGTYPSAAHGSSALGIGFQVGAFFESPTSDWNAGVSYKSPQWFEEFKFNAHDNAGGSRRLGIDLDYPSIISVGVAYRGLERIRLACDVRYIDYENAAGFQAAGFDAAQAVTGFGWNSIWVASVGAEFELHECFKWRIGYCVNDNPIPASSAFFNHQAPAIVQNHLSTGVTCEMKSGWLCSMAYHYGFRNSVSGRWWNPATSTQIPGTRITNTLSTHGLTMGISKRF